MPPCKRVLAKTSPPTPSCGRITCRTPARTSRPASRPGRASQPSCTTWSSPSACGERPRKVTVAQRTEAPGRCWHDEDPENRDGYELHLTLLPNAAFLPQRHLKASPSPKTRRGLPLPGRSAAWKRSADAAEGLHALRFRRSLKVLSLHGPLR